MTGWLSARCTGNGYTLKPIIRTFINVNCCVVPETSVKGEFHLNLPPELSEGNTGGRLKAPGGDTLLVLY